MTILLSLDKELITYNKSVEFDEYLLIIISNNFFI